ncbi:MAG TPA: hypothetical protein VD969_21860 [Symbiobacteriaceae bacterium]|nr:hypothetical protein [Symbiobacteriaceae bacterium]
MKRHIMLLLLGVALVVSGCVRAPTPQFKDATAVPLKTTWKLDLPEGVNAADVDGVAILDGQQFRPVSVERAGSRLGLSPAFPYERGSQFTVRVFLKDGRREDLPMPAEGYPTLVDGLSVEVPAAPAMGFYYPYFLYLPKEMPRGEKTRLLVEPNSTAISDDLLHHIERSRAQLTPKRLSTTIAGELKLPVLVPVFPRVVHGPATHDLSRETLLVPTGPLRRVDLQLLAMIEDARKILAHHGIETEEKVFMHGYADIGHFVNRFAILHPQVVRAVAAGAVDGVVTLPAASYQGRRLRFPVGIADLTDITGIRFDEIEYQRVAQFIHMGERDTNDRVQDPDVFAREDGGLIRELIGAKMMPDRWARTQQLYKELGVAAQFVTYLGMAHQPGPTEDLVAFFRANDNDGPPAFITATQQQ